MRATSFVLIAALVVGSAPAVAQTRAAVARAGATPKLAVVAPTDPNALAAILAGPGVTIGNATYTGAPAAAASFSAAQASVGIDAGVVLSTGNAADVNGPNNDTSSSTDNAAPGLPALDALVAPYKTLDAAILEFDVTPVGSTLAIRYVFASEEYPEFVGTPYNDVLAIFVNGVNCANYGGRPVTVNTINATVNSSLFVDNDSGDRDTQMDGLTVPLDCVAAVKPGVANHVVVAIADTADPAHDSAAFLAAGGIRSPAAGPLTNSNIVKAIEYHHAGFDHYFITAAPQEIGKLDDGTFKGWERTGQAFTVFVSGTAGAADVCRFFSTAFDPRSSHFYTPSASECATVKGNANWSYEGIVFGLGLPAADGTCPDGMQPLYRVYNNGMGDAPNHRYMTDYSTFGVMQQLGWTPEGAGEGVIGCVPV